MCVGVMRGYMYQGMRELTWSDLAQERFVWNMELRLKYFAGEKSFQKVLNRPDLDVIKPVTA